MASLSKRSILLGSLIGITTIVFIFFLISVRSVLNDPNAHDENVVKTTEQRFWIRFKDKGENPTLSISDKTKENRRQLGLEVLQPSDYAVNQDYIRSIVSNCKVEVLSVSRWFNAISANLDQDQIDLVKRQGFVEGVYKISPGVLTASGQEGPLNTVERIDALDQVNGKVLSQHSLTGEGIEIGIIDIGYVKADIDPVLQHIFSGGRVLGIKDFVSTKNAGFFANVYSTSDKHGKYVWNLIAGLDETTNRRHGLATGASFYLARADHGRYEFKAEEDFWVAALEWLDSLGVRLVHSSLGYSKGYDNPVENYLPSQMNGETATSSLAAKIAVEKKGMIIVTSAGNDGEDSNWKVVSAPADVDKVITVGATDTFGKKQLFSSEGPQGLKYTKPDISCFSEHGTSFAAPMVTGLIACLLEAEPKLTSSEIKEIIHKSGHLYPFNNNYLGYGIPNSEKAIDLLLQPKKPAFNAEVQIHAGTKYKLEDVTSSKLVVFHKSDERYVIKQELVSVKKGKAVVKRRSNCARSTISNQEGLLIEIAWK